MWFWYFRFNILFGIEVSNTGLDTNLDLKRSLFYSKHELRKLKAKPENLIKIKFKIRANYTIVSEEVTNYALKQQLLRKI